MKNTFESLSEKFTDCNSSSNSSTTNSNKHVNYLTEKIKLEEYNNPSNISKNRLLNISEDEFNQNNSQNQIKSDYKENKNEKTLLNKLFVGGLDPSVDESNF
jgi:hypothetical protein